MGTRFDNGNSSATVYQRFLTPELSPNSLYKEFDGGILSREILYMRLRNGSSTYDFAAEDWDKTFESLRTKERIIIESREKEGFAGQFETVEYAETQKLDLTNNPYEVTTKQIKDMDNVAVISSRNLNKMDSQNAFVLIVFIMFLLMFGSALFNGDANVLVVGPICNMVDKISQLMVDPLGLNEQIEASIAAAKAGGMVTGDGQLTPRSDEIIVTWEQLTFAQKYFAFL